MKSKISAIFVGLFALGITRALGVPIDSKALSQNIRKSFSLPPGVEVELRETKPSSIPGVLIGTVQFRLQDKSQDQSILLTEDGRYYILSELYPLEPSPIRGILGPKENYPDADAKFYITEDKKYFFRGKMVDLTIDPDTTNLSKIKLDGVPFRGSSSAPIVLVEYSDLQCPYCRTAHMALEEGLLKTYNKEVKWVFKHFPLTSIHPWAMNAAIAVTCATRQKSASGWKLQQAFFDHQKEITPTNVREKALEFAKDSGVNAGKFETCYDRQETKDVVESDLQEAAALRVNSTPTFFINGRLLQGFRDFDSVKTIIDEMLAEKKASRN